MCFHFPHSSRQSATLSAASTLRKRSIPTLKLLSVYPAIRGKAYKFLSVSIRTRFIGSGNWSVSYSFILQYNKFIFTIQTFKMSIHVFVSIHTSTFFMLCDNLKTSVVPSTLTFMATDNGSLNFKVAARWNTTEIYKIVLISN